MKLYPVVDPRTGVRAWVALCAEGELHYGLRIQDAARRAIAARAPIALHAVV